MRVWLAGLIATAGLLIDASARPAQPHAICDRACLTHLLDRYVDALVARAPSQLPLAATVKFTENGSGSISATDFGTR